MFWEEFRTQSNSNYWMHLHFQALGARSAKAKTFYALYKSTLHFFFFCLLSSFRCWCCCCDLFESVVCFLAIMPPRDMGICTSLSNRHQRHCHPYPHHELLSSSFPVLLPSFPAPPPHQAHHRHHSSDPNYAFSSSSSVSSTPSWTSLCACFSFCRHHHCHHHHHHHQKAREEVAE